jgi:hypothetical protein
LEVVVVLRTLLGWFVVAHGLLTIVIWSPNPQTAATEAPMDTSHSWLLGDARAISLTLAIIAGVVIASAGVGFLTHQAWWPTAGLVGGAMSLVLFGLFFTPWWAAGIAISVALVVAAGRAGFAF